MASARQSESDADRAKRLAMDRARTTAARQEESQEDRARRLTQDQARHATARQEESEDDRTRRLTQDQARHATARQEESEDDRARRLTQDQARHATARQEESEDDRSRRRLGNQMRMATYRRPPSSSFFSAPGAAFDYSPSTCYDSDPVVQIGGLTIQCTFCGAQKFPGETPGMCCSGGKIVLPFLRFPPQPLRDLLDGTSPSSKEFLDNIRQYNSAFQMTSFGATKEVVEPGFMPTFKVQGQVYHLLGSISPLPNEPAKFLQIYFMGDSQQEPHRHSCPGNAGYSSTS